MVEKSQQRWSPVPECRSFYSVSGIAKSFEGTELTKAVKSKDQETVQRLLYRSADPNAKYEMLGGAGFLGIPWRGSAAVGAVCIGSLDILKLLHEYRAVLCGRHAVEFKAVRTWPWESFADTKEGEWVPHSTLLYEAAQVGNKRIVEFLLDTGEVEGDLREPVAHQDISGRQSKPLEIAAERGHGEVVGLLLEHMRSKVREELGATSKTNSLWKGLAQIGEMSTTSSSWKADQEDMVSALHRAICNSCTDVIDHLIADGVLLHRLADFCNADKTSIDSIDANENVVVSLLGNTEYQFSDNLQSIIAVVEALRKHKEDFMLQFDVPNKSEAAVHFFIKVLRMPKCEDIIDLIFREHHGLFFVDCNSGNARRRQFKKAFFANAMNAASGPTVSNLGHIFEYLKGTGVSTTRVDLKRWKGFIDLLMGKKYLPTDVLMCKRARLADSALAQLHYCVLPGIHRNPYVFLALAHRNSNEIYRRKGCQAIILLGWRDALPYYIANIFLDVVICCLNVCAAVGWNDKALVVDTIFEPLFNSHAILALLVGCLCATITRETLQFVGFISLGKSEFGRLRSDSILAFCYRAVLDLLSVSLSAWFVLSMAYDTTVPDRTTRILLGFNGFVQLHLLAGRLCGLEPIGLAALPVKKAFQHLEGWIVCVLCTILGFFHMYYSWGLNSLRESLVLTWNVAVLLDFDYADLEAASVGQSDWYWYIRAFVWLSTWLIGVVFMNILIGILSMSYEVGFNEKRELVFGRRAEIIRDYYLVKSGFELRGFMCTKRQIPSTSGIVAPDVSSDPSAPHLLTQIDNFDHVWYCIAKEDATSQIEDKIDALQTSMNVYASEFEDKIDALQSIMKQLMNRFVQLEGQILTKRLEPHVVERVVVVDPPPPPPPPPRLIEVVREEQREQLDGRQLIELEVPRDLSPSLRIDRAISTPPKMKVVGEQGPRELSPSPRLGQAIDDTRSSKKIEIVREQGTRDLSPLRLGQAINVARSPQTIEIVRERGPRDLSPSTRLGQAVNATRSPQTIQVVGEKGPTELNPSPSHGQAITPLPNLMEVAGLQSPTELSPSPHFGQEITRFPSFSDQAPTELNPSGRLGQVTIEKRPLVQHDVASD